MALLPAMRWRGRRASAQIEDRRGMRVAGGGLALGGGGLVLLLVLSLLTGRSPLEFIDVVAGPPRASVEQGRRGVPEDEAGEFVAVILGSTEDAWERHFAARGRTYRRPTLVLFSDAVQSACGLNSSAVGPFYCPLDQKLYVDLSFFTELAERFGAPGDFAQAYVIAHEVGHHVQNLLGTLERVHAARARAPGERANALAVRLELQADCLAGVWGHDARDMLDPGDAEEGLAAAAAIGDDRIQRRAQGYTVPETWTHGSSEQRVRWLRRGIETGAPDGCDTFAGQ